MEQACSILDLSFQMGEILLESGAEISRVQETMERVAAHGMVDKFHVYVLTNAIFANGVENGVTHSTEIQFIKHSSIHIGRISAINQLSRELVSGSICLENAYARLQEIREIPYSKPPFSLFCCAFGCAAFAFLFGGSLWDALPAFLCGIVLEGYLYLQRRTGMSKFILNLSASAMVATCAVLLYLLGLGARLDVVIIGSIIRLVPGVALTTSIRDFFNSDYLSGTIRMIDALIVGVCLGIGVGVVMKLFSLILGGPLL